MNVPRWMTRLLCLTGVFFSTSYAVASDCDSCPPADSGCDAICSEPSCGCSGWSFSADALFLRRSDPGSEVLAFNTANTAESLNSDDFEFDSEVGFDLSLTRQLSNGNGLQIRYFGIDQWDAPVSGATTAGDPLQINAAVPLFADAGDAIAGRYLSELKNVEVNLTLASSQWLELLVGFRHLELSERAEARLINAATPFEYSAETNNRLYGAQFGAIACLSDTDVLSLDVIGKAGVYGNHSSQDSLIRSGAATLAANGSGSPTSFIGEVGVLSGLRLTDSLTFRSGYRLLWLDKVAVANDQLSASNFFSGKGYDGSGDVFYHGAFVGIEFAR